MGVLVGRPVGHRLGVEHHQIGRRPGPDDSAVAETQPGGRLPRHLVDRLGPGEGALLPDIRAEDLGEAAVLAGMGLPNVGLFGTSAEAEVVGADGDVGILEPAGHVGIEHQEVDHRDPPLGLEEEIDHGVGRLDLPGRRDLGQGPALRPGDRGALGDQDVRPRDGAVGPEPFALGPPTLVEDPPARHGIGETPEQGRRPAVVDPRRQEAGQGRRARGVRIHVGGDVDPPAAGVVQHSERLAHLGPVGLEARLEMGDLDGDAALLADLDRLRDRALEGRALAPDVRGVEAPRASRHHPGQGHELRGLGVDARGVDEPRREAEGARVEGVREEGRHPPLLVRRGRPLGEAHGGDAEGPVADEGHDVGGEPGLAQAIEPGAEAGPVPGERGREERRPLAEEPAPRRRGGRREAAHPRDFGGDALANLGLGGGHGQQREVGVRVHVDEPRGDERAPGIHDPPGLAPEARRDGDHALALDGHVGADGRPARPVEDVSAADQPVERHGPGG